MHALYVCLICMSYMYALYVCRICMPVEAQMTGSSVWVCFCFVSCCCFICGANVQLCWSVENAMPAFLLFICAISFLNYLFYFVFICSVWFLSVLFYFSLFYFVFETAMPGFLLLICAILFLVLTECVPPYPPPHTFFLCVGYTGNHHGHGRARRALRPAGWKKNKNEKKIENKFEINKDKSTPSTTSSRLEKK